jgi:predicted nucleic acid-binding protein
LTRETVIDTNVVLDVYVFADERAQALRQGLEQGSLQWLATQAMRDELARVLDYPQIASRMAFHGIQAAQVLGPRPTSPARTPMTRNSSTSPSPAVACS